MNEYHINMVLSEVYQERVRQDAKWGEQNHPDFDPEVTAHIPSETKAKELCDNAFVKGYGTYSHILLEEFVEAIQVAEYNKDLLREELVQVAAVAVSWIEKLDRDKLAGVTQ